VVFVSTDGASSKDSPSKRYGSVSDAVDGAINGNVSKSMSQQKLNPKSLKKNFNKKPNKYWCFECCNSLCIKTSHRRMLIAKLKETVFLRSNFAIANLNTSNNSVTTKNYSSKFVR